MTIKLKAVFFQITYDLVVCAYSLLELPSFQSRLQTLVNLWNKTEKYLVVVEQGTNTGFKVSFVVISNIKEKWFKFFLGC